MSSVVVRSVVGLEDRVNDVVTPVMKRDQYDEVVVYFGGDVQDLEENMIKHRDNSRYREWSLENTSLLLQQAFPDSLVAVIRPKRMERSTFSCYDNFVSSNSVGSPQHSDHHGAIKHLEHILLNLKVDMNQCPVKLIGFSKGVVVLNQILRELSSSSDTVVKISTIMWLDGGHNGGQGIWPTDKKLLETLVDKNISVDVRVTPYQVKNTNRPWIGREEKSFTSTLSRLGAKISRKLYFEDQPASIDNHFNVIKTLLTSPGHL